MVVPQTHASEHASTFLEHAVDTRRVERPPSASAHRRRRVNVGSIERKVSVAAGAVLAGLGIARRDAVGLLIAGVGGGLVYRGASGQCQAYEALGINTADDPSEQAGFEVVEAILINKSAEELYSIWRELENLPAIMSHLEEVHEIGALRSHWVASAPSIGGGTIEWDAEITEDVPNRKLAWQSLPGSSVDNRGSVEFRSAPGDRGTIVRIEMTYAPPAGHVGRWLAMLSGDAPETQVREDLRRFKRVMETGEVPTTEGQPRGSCAGMLRRLVG